MARTRLLSAVCAVSLLATVPAFAQSSPQTGDAGSGSAAPAGGTTAPADKMGSSGGSHAMMDHHSTMHPRNGMHAMGSRSQNGEVDRLNDRSYQAARSGQAFNGSVPGDMSTPSGSGSMSDMSGGSMSKTSPSTTGGNK